VLATDYEANLLQIQKGDPLILLDSVVYLDDSRPIEYFRALHRGGRARFEVDLIRVKKSSTYLNRNL
jgi:DNA-binding GntR family transcriptional regulator